MKELSIEDKAKAYDEAIERAKAIYYQGSYKPDTAAIIAETLLNIFPALKESEDERIRRAIKKALQVRCDGSRIISDEPVTLEEAIAWLEKQGEHANFRNKIQIGDKVTRNEDGVLVNLSQLNRVAKKDEKQGEQNPAEWTMQDEEELQIALDTLVKAGQHSAAKWLKNICLRPQTNWKPSDAQMDSITCAVRKMKESACYDSELVSLFNDLKKLREE